MKKQKQKLERLIITCGGTGGHFYPGLTIAREFIKSGGEALLLLSGRNIKTQTAVAEAQGIPAIGLQPMPSPRNPVSAVKFFYGLFTGTLTSMRLMRKFSPNAVLGMGSFASLPVILAARFCSFPIFLHDGNARIGKANRFLSRWAKCLGTAFPPVNAHKIKCPLQITGMPVRTELLNEKLDKPSAVGKLNRIFKANLNPELPTLLIFGGSQGAQIFNKTIPRTLLKQEMPIQILHLTGPRKFEDVKYEYAAAVHPVLCLPFVEKMHYFYEAADLVFSRSGGSTVAELCIFGKPAILVPYPYAAEGHQRDNAEYMVNSGAAEVVDNAKCTAEYIETKMSDWLNNPAGYSKAGQKALALSKPHATEDILKMINSQL
ncbi:undecaprenyldiphospho-muramoylpentapeptide beta-N-acetylglucosaminyltransferase [Lentisphaerota bacterium ZTH]|nr:undecaprenyldiphospho-muramoylpentapeptide beta-N-acetylglucosaminyltransferase [Lentisphaerota bacterium]WET06913.1 undecaprenyldiphospho-muramoylpentapeptide beta-N-acetylglucosaminyltransferase [Lentisphaerota bacterium ZTH]